MTAIHSPAHAALGDENVPASVSGLRGNSHRSGTLQPGGLSLIDARAVVRRPSATLADLTAARDVLRDSAESEDIDLARELTLGGVAPVADMGQWPAHFTPEDDPDDLPPGAGFILAAALSVLLFVSIFAVGDVIIAAIFAAFDWIASTYYAVAGLFEDLPL